MVLNSLKTTKNRKSTSPPLGYDFALLGLSAKEARVEVIRRAAYKTAARIEASHTEDQSDHEALKSDLAASTYRLLDPRKRNRHAERIQLCIFSEKDLDQQQYSTVNLLAQEPLVPVELVGGSTENVRGERRVDSASIRQPVPGRFHVKTRRSSTGIDELNRLGTITISLLAIGTLATASAVLLLALR